MARYIEREKFLKKCTEVFGYFGVLVKAIEEISDECTTADVAPKSEVAREIFEDLESQIVYRNGLYNFPIITHEFIAELKKKYTEDQT